MICVSVRVYIHRKYVTGIHEYTATFSPLLPSSWQSPAMATIKRPNTYRSSWAGGLQAFSPPNCRPRTTRHHQLNPWSNTHTHLCILYPDCNSMLSLSLSLSLSVSIYLSLFVCVCIYKDTHKDDGDIWCCIVCLSSLNMSLYNLNWPFEFHWKRSTSST
jgi:hypothetical protein